jgi:hypothetical protein
VCILLRKDPLNTRRQWGRAKADSLQTGWPDWVIFLPIGNFTSQWQLHKTHWKHYLKVNMHLIWQKLGKFFIKNIWSPCMQNTRRNKTDQTSFWGRAKAESFSHSLFFWKQHYSTSRCMISMLESRDTSGTAPTPCVHQVLLILRVNGFRCPANADHYQLFFSGERKKTA